jgi:cell division protein FtsN
MSRLFSILVSLFILFLVYLWINHLTKTDTQAPLTKTEELKTPAQKDKETKVTSKPKSPSTDEKPTQKNKPESTIDKKTAEKPISKKKPAQSSVVTGIHLVVAGNFLERANAEKHLKSIKDLGYANAEILNFEISQYYTVIAGRYEDLAEAQRVAKKLKDIHSIDTYVRNGN